MGGIDKFVAYSTMTFIALFSFSDCAESLKSISFRFF